jgi:integrase
MSEAPYMGVHRGCRGASRHRAAAPEEQKWLRNEERGRKRPARVHPPDPLGADPCPERIRLGEFLVRWLGYQRARGVRSLTLETYEGYIRREIAPVIGGLEIATIRPGHVRSVLARMQKRGLSAATIAQARGVLGSALRQAVEEGLIPTNRVTAVKRPRIRRRELHWPTPDQLTTLLHASMGTMWEIPLLLSMVTGARRSEILGLAWQDVDLRSATIRICRGVQRMPGRDPARLRSRRSRPNGLAG